MVNRFYIKYKKIITALEVNIEKHISFNCSSFAFYFQFSNIYQNKTVIIITKIENAIIAY